MKKYSTAMLLILAVLGLCYWLFDESLTARNKAKSTHDSTQSQVDSLKTQRDASTNQIVALSRSVTESVTFLKSWKEYYLANRDYEAILTRIADETRCAVVARRWEPKKISVGKLDYETDTFTGMVVGDYRDVTAFIAAVESNLQLSTIWILDFKVREIAGEVSCTMTVCLPVLVFEGSVL